jgi:phage tail-like protein
MRGMIADLATPHPLADTLPAMLREDAFARNLCASFDDLLAPAILSLDTFAAYLDPTTTPEDMLVWLAQWLGFGTDHGNRWLPQRHELQAAGRINAIRGTRRSIQLVIENALGVPVEVTETGAARWTPTAGGELPGLPDPAITVVVRPPSGVEVDLDRLEALIRSVTPVHVRYTVTVQAPTG